MMLCVVLMMSCVLHVEAAAVTHGRFFSGALLQSFITSKDNCTTVSGAPGTCSSKQDCEKDGGIVEGTCSALFRVCCNTRGRHQSIWSDKLGYTSGDPIAIYFNIGGGVASKNDWIGIYPFGVFPSSTPTDFQYVCGRKSECDSTMNKGRVTFSTVLSNGKWSAWYLVDTGYISTYKAVTVFKVSGFSCTEATVDVSPNTHLHVTEGQHASKLAFSSCIKTRKLSGTTFWSDVRASEPDVWLWLGDNMYADGTDMNIKRSAYNDVRNEPSYISHGLLKSGNKIPIMATWDDHDFAFNDAGNNYICAKQSQNEYVTHFNIPSTDPRHKDFPGGQQDGVYNSQMFLEPGTSNNGIHVIMLDARVGRDPIIPALGCRDCTSCKGINTQMLSETQWGWLDNELAKTSVVKVIASSVQVLSPTEKRLFGFSGYCSEDRHSGGETTSFTDAISAVGEGENWEGNISEQWSQIPQERLKLLGKAQKSINDGKTKMVIFVSGDKHWAELLAKRMPDSDEYGASQVLYEVTASGIYQNRPILSRNSNRLKDRSCDHKGNGPYNQACVFPWSYKGKTYTDCAQPDGAAPWCSTKVDPLGNHFVGHWGYCAHKHQELAQETYSNATKICAQNKYFMCKAKANYGTLSVDFHNKKVKMQIRGPEENEEAYHVVTYD